MKQVKGFWLPDDDSYFHNCMDERGFQIDHLDKALGYVDNFNMALDCGAHIGTWTLEMANKFESVVAFEPHPDTFECLRQNLSHSGRYNVTAQRLAIGDEHKRVSIVDDKKRVGNTGSRFIGEAKSSEINVNMITIDSLELRHLDFLKLDLEGYEYFAILGGLQTIKKYKPVILVEEKSFNYRYDIDDKLATKALLEIGAKIVDQIGKDYIFSFN